MSRPPVSFLSSLRSAFPRRPMAGRPFAFSRTRPGTNFTFDGASGSTRHSSSLTSTSFRSTFFRPITAILLIAPFLTGYLGVWQVQRLQWKLELIDEVDRNLAKDPIPLPGKINLAAIPDFAFRRVLVRGRFTGPYILQGPQTRDGVPGYHLILPLDRSESGGSTILVNRGFIKTAEGDAIRSGAKPVPGLGPNGGPGEIVTVEGMLPKADPNAKSYFTPDNRPESNQWFWKDVPAMTEYVGGEAKNVQPLLVDAIDHGEIPASFLMADGLPVGRAPMVDLRNQHLSYAITWFSLCAATSVMLVMALTKGRTKKLPQRRAFGEKKK